MKILFIRSTNGVSGAEVYTMRLVEALRKKNVDASILTNHFPFYQRAKKEHIPIAKIFLPIPEAGTKKEFLILILWFLYLVPMYIWRIKQMEKGKKFDVVVLESMNEKLILSPYLAILSYNVFWIEHGPLFIADRFNLIKRLYIHKTKWVKKIIAVSDDTKKDLIHGGVPKEKVERVYIGIDTTTVRKKDKKKSNHVVIGFVGGIAREKGFMEFGEAARVLLKKHNNISFLVVGDGPLLSWAKQRVQDLGIAKQVQFTGYVSDAIPFIEKMDIFFFPTHHYEGISIAALEAMALGKIVVARDIGGNRELVINKKTGFLFTSPKEGQAILEKIISGKMQIKEIGKRAVKHIQTDFSWSHQIPLFLNVFQQ